MRGLDNVLGVDHLLEEHEPGVEELPGTLGQVGVLEPLLRAGGVAEGDGPVEGVEKGLLTAANDKLKEKSQ